MVKRLVRNTCFFLGVVCVLLQLAQAININGTAGKDINGQYLLDMGRRINNPMLQAIGMAIKNLHPHSCGAWTSWSPCTARTLGYFGIKERTRKCGNEPGTVNMETDSSICGILCPSDYDKTTNGLCVKIYNVLKSHLKAIDQCNTDGGNLINIDSLVKYNDIVNLTSAFKSSYIRIDGRRKDTSFPWMFEHRTHNAFFKWAPGQPNNSSTDLCLIIVSSLMHDASCRDGNFFMCEIIV